MSVRAGRLRHRITLERLTNSDDEYGEPTSSYEVYGSFWAAVESLSGRELWQAQQVKATTTHRVTMRYVTGVAPGMRVIHKARTLEIDSVVDVGERTRELQLMCTEVTD